MSDYWAHRVWTQLTCAVPGDSIHVGQGTVEPVTTAEMLTHPHSSLSLSVLFQHLKKDQYRIESVTGAQSMNVQAP